MARYAIPFLMLASVGWLAVDCTNDPVSGEMGNGSVSASGVTGAAGTASGSSGGASGGSGGAGTSGGAGARTGGGSGTNTSTGTGAGASGAGGDGAGNAGSGGTSAIVDAGNDRLSAPDADPHAGWQLTWSQEFNEALGTKPDPMWWSYDLGGGGWGVAQLQSYTNAAANAATDGRGNLAIVAIKDAQGNYTSARLKTQGKFEQLYGRFEISVKIPGGVGIWPAFWMMGNDFENPTPWPDCGEIDVLENRGIEPGVNHGSLHGPGYSGSMPLTGLYTLPSSAAFANAFHTFAIEWEMDVVRFYVDDQLYQTRTPLDVGTNKWVYQHPFFLLLNLAVGGRFPQNPDATTMFPVTMLVDYIRVFARPPGG